MRKRKKFHEVRYPQKGASKSRNGAIVTSGTETMKTTDIEDGSMTPWEDADTRKSDAEEFRFLRISGFNVPDRADEIEVENGRRNYNGSWTGGEIENCIIMLTDVETGFFRECVEKDGGGWYGSPNHRHLERYGLNPRAVNESKFRAEHIPVVEEREREDLTSDSYIAKHITGQQRTSRHSENLPRF